MYYMAATMGTEKKKGGEEESGWIENWERADSSTSSVTCGAAFGMLVKQEKDIGKPC